MCSPAWASSASSLAKAQLALSKTPMEAPITLAMINASVELEAVSIHIVLSAAPIAPTMTNGFRPRRSDTRPVRNTAMAKAPAITSIMRPNAAAGSSKPTESLRKNNP